MMGWPLTVESTRRERDTLALPFTVDRVTAESDTVLPPLTVLLIRVERPLRFACPFTTDPLRILVGPETVARPQIGGIARDVHGGFDRGRAGHRAAAVLVNDCFLCPARPLRD